jgi:hypothetical protein
VHYPEDFDDVSMWDRTQFDRLPLKSQVACCIHMLEAAVNHDGFDGLFSNYSGAYIPEILSALRQIGAPNTLALVERAIALAYPDGYPEDPADHQDALTYSDEVSEKLDLMDQEFFRYPEPLPELVNGYLARDT